MIARMSGRVSVLVGTALLLASTVLPGQGTTGTVTGRVTLRGTGEGIPGVTVSATGTQQGALTRGDGTYRLTARPGRYELRARLIGFTVARESVTVAAGTTTTRDFTLERSATQLEAVAVTGTRAQERTVVSSPVPVDVLNALELRSTGRVETAQVIQMLAPSFNFPRPAVADGTDHVRPATLRGLAPDQTLVLINGKRRYPSALVNNNGTVGRGASAVDLNAIPASMIERIEVLRDGAAAQYGSDAIAGVINIILKGAGAGDASVQVGQFNTELEGRGTIRDGTNTTLALSKGFASGTQRYLHVGGEYRNRGMTNRSFEDPRQQFFANDSREPSANRLNHWSGDAGTADVIGMFNAGYGLENGVQAYGFGAFGRRDGRSTGFFRRPLDDRTIRSIWPNGFLPNIVSDITDASLAGGVKGEAKGWRWDASQTWGTNAFGITVDNSNNASLGAQSPTSFDAGTLGFSQAITNLDLFREFRPGGKPLRLAAGAEFRWENYTIEAGEPDSYRFGSACLLDAQGRPRVDSQGRCSPLPAAGAQVFPGFTPGDATDESRTAGAAYIDIESDLSDKFLLSFAGRYENFSDFGSTTNGKLAARFSPVKQFALRGALATGFRAPSLQQQFFTSTATIFVLGVPTEIRTFPVDSRPAQLLGATPLKPEKSLNSSIGFTFDPGSNFTLTVDAYRIVIDDRIVLSSNFTGTAIQNWFVQNGLQGVAGGRYFTNAINTRTNGVDVVANYGKDFGKAGLMRLTAGYNANRNKVTDVVASTPPQLGNLSEVLFGREERGRIEIGQPRTNFLFTAMHDVQRWSLTARTQRFGAVTGVQALQTIPRTDPRYLLDQEYDPRWITDLSVSYKLRGNASIAVGADNVFDVYPEENYNRGNVATGFSGNSNFGIFRYPGISPFGFNGRFLYTRLAYRF
jgi:iron complex outermembrane recepter protein